MEIRRNIMKPTRFADTVFNVSQQWATNILDELFPEVVQIPSTINVISTMTTGLWQNKKKGFKTMLLPWYGTVETSNSTVTKTNATTLYI
jgi:hypothetical protein